LEGGGAEVVDGGGEGGPEDFEAVKADQILLGALGVVGADVGGGFERAAEALARFHRMAGYALHLALVAGEERDEQVSLVEGPGAENNGLALVRDESAFGHKTECRG